MTIEIITAHEADQLIRMRRPLGTDQQGRHPEVAHAATSIGSDDAVEAWRREGIRAAIWFWSCTLGGCAVLAVVGALAMGWRL